MSKVEVALLSEIEFSDIAAQIFLWNLWKKLISPTHSPSNTKSDRILSTF